MNYCVIFSDRLLPADMVYICEFLKNHPEVNEIDLSYNMLEDEGFEILCHSTLNYQNHLEHINFGKCELTHASMETFYYVALENRMTIKTLRLFGNKIGPQVSIQA